MPHDKVSLQIDDCPSIQLPRHSTIETGFKALSLAVPLAARLNGVVVSVLEEVSCDSTVSGVREDEETARQILRNSLCFLFMVAAKRLFPRRELVLEHAIDAGFYFRFADSPPTAAEAKSLNDCFEALRREALELEPVGVSWAEAARIFEDRREVVDLLGQTNQETVRLVRCAEFSQVYASALVRDSSRVAAATIRHWKRGYVIFPVDKDPGAEGTKRLETIFSIYEVHKAWGRNLGVSTLSELNARVARRSIHDFVWTAEARQTQDITDLARSIAGAESVPRIVLIAGPSSSGKTTFAKKLSIQLKVCGLDPLTLGLDDYFVNRVDTPRNPDGSYNFEDIQALDIAFLNEHLLALLDGQRVELPVFDFKKGERRMSGKSLQLPSGGILVIEGIHGLNETLTHLVPQDSKYKIYISAFNQLSVDKLTRVSTSDNRLLRRVLRDFRYRGHSAEATLAMWASVRRGEERYIFPFQNSARAAFNSALDYEIGVLKPYVEPLLESISPASPHYSEARRLLTFLDQFLAIPSELVPGNSILREFLGGSDFSY